MWDSQAYTNVQACAQAYQDCVKAKSCKVTTRRDLAAGTLKLRKVKSVGHLVEARTDRHLVKAPRDLRTENTSNQKVQFPTKMGTTRRDLAAGERQLRKLKYVGRLDVAPRDRQTENKGKQEVYFSTTKDTNKQNTQIEQTTKKH